MPPASPPGIVIEARGLTKKFNAEAAVLDLNLDVPQGTIFGLIGPSGCGKTTTVRLMTGVYLPTAGQVSVLGVSPTFFSSHTRRQLGYMPQHFVLYPDLSVWENMNFSASLYGMGLNRGRRLKELLEIVELYAHRNKQARSISGGMQRRLALAATLAHDPLVIFLDEPTAGIDPVLRRKFWDYFQALKARGRTIVVTTQYVGEADSCDLVAVMASGRIVMSIVAAVQQQAGAAQGQLAAAQGSAQAVQTALHTGDVKAARQHQMELVQNLNAVELGVGAGIGLLSGVEQGLGQPSTGGQSTSLLALLTRIQQGTRALDTIPDNQSSYSTQEQTAGEVAMGLAQLKHSLAQFTSIQPAVLVSPFRPETKSVAGLPLNVTNYYAPGVLALLLQHLAVTFGALSMIGEQQTGTVELFRVSPVSPGEVLIGKYASYLLFGGSVAAILTVLLRFVLGVPMLGSWFNFAGVVLLVLFASLSIGFVISLLAQSDSQAVQFGMLVLLASVLFSGFFTALYLFAPAVRAIAYLLPVTYGIQLLQSVMLRGAAPDITLLGGLLLIGLVLSVIAWFQTARLMARR